MEMKWVLLWMVLLMAMTSCVESRCYRHSDCPSGKVCEGETGQCVVPECNLDTECAQGTVCESYQCVEGCVTSKDCPSGFECSSRRCLEYSPACQCPSSPAFCLADVNPGSPGYQQPLCLPSQVEGQAVVLLFGSVGCSHCRDLFRALSDVAKRVDADAGTVFPVFVNLATVTATAPEITAWFPEATTPILQDTSAQGVWGLFGADWYHLILLDRNGCVVKHWGPAQATDLQGALGDEVAQMWQEATAAECEAVTLEDVVTGDTAEPDVLQETSLVDSSNSDVTVGPEVLPEVLLEDSSPEILDAVEGETVEVVPDADVQGDQSLGEVQYDLVSEVEPQDAETDLGPPEEVFALHELCQMVTALPPAVGEKVPHFLCMDRNAASATSGQGISDWVLKEAVWVAYFGACT